MSVSTLYLKQLEVGPMQNFAYLLGDRKKKECVVVDPAWEPEKILAEAKRDGMKVIGALATHSHFDHVNAFEGLLKRTGGKIYVNQAEVDFTENSAEDALGVLVKFSADQRISVKEGDRIPVGGILIDVIHTPGHTPGSQCFLAGDNLISGDTLFVGYCGRCDLAGGSAQALHESLSKKLFLLDDEIVLYPGHDYSGRPSAKLGEEKRTNPYLRARTFGEFTQALKGLLD